MNGWRLTKETRNTLHVHIPVSIGTHQVLEQLELPSSIRLYCLSTDEDKCPSNYRTIQVVDDHDPNGRVSRKSICGKKGSSSVHMKTKSVWQKRIMSESSNYRIGDRVSRHAKAANPSHSEYDHD